jgi:hypothetical protein
LHKPARRRPIAPVHPAFDDLRQAEEEAIRLVRIGHVFETHSITLREYSRDRF